MREDPCSRLKSWILRMPSEVWAVVKSTKAQRQEGKGFPACWGRKSDGCLEVQAQSSSAGEWSVQCLGGAVCSAEPLLLCHWASATWASATWAGSGGGGLGTAGSLLSSGAVPEVRADTSRAAWGTIGAAAHAKSALWIDSLSSSRLVNLSPRKK